MRFAAIGALALLASACQTIQTKPIELSAAQLEAVKRHVAQELKDPESARFGRIAAGRADNGSIEVCGIVNGKNSFGAYSFENAFDMTINAQGALGLARVQGITPGASMGAAILNNCRANGVPI